jgi:hypothetical protein
MFGATWAAIVVNVILKVMTPRLEGVRVFNGGGVESNLTKRSQITLTNQNVSENRM